MCIRPSEVVEVVRRFLGYRDSGGMYWERLRQNVGPEVSEWAEVLYSVEPNSVGVPSFS